MSQVLISSSKKTSAILIRAVLVLVAALITSSFMAQGNCQVDELLKKNRPLLESYQFIKFFPIETNRQTEKVEYSYLLNRDTKYRLVIVDNGVKGERMMVTLRDPQKKVMATNKDKQKRDFMNQLDFVCPVTGVYYFEVSFEDGRKDCGLNILGYQK
jgi:hypothetical protein